MKIILNNGLNFRANKEEAVKSIVDSAFHKLAESKKRNMVSYLGTTKNGTNITIDELSLSKEAILYIQSTRKQKSPFEIFKLRRISGQEPKVFSENGKEISSKRKLNRISNLLKRL